MQTLKLSIQREIHRLETELSAAKAYLSTLGGPIPQPMREKPVKAKLRVKETRPRAKAGALKEAILASLTNEPMSNGQIRNLAQSKVPGIRIDAVKVYKNLTLLVKEGKAQSKEIGPRQFVYSLPLSA